MYLSEIDLEKVAQFCSLFKKSSSVCMLHKTKLPLSRTPHPPYTHTPHTNWGEEREIAGCNNDVSIRVNFSFTGVLSLVLFKYVD